MHSALSPRISYRLLDATCYTGAGDARRAAEDPARSEDARRSPSYLVLFIEDNLSSLRLMERILHRVPGVDLINATSGGQGLALAHARLPDLIVLDLNLPDMPGQQVFSELRAAERIRSIPVLVVTSDVRPEVAAEMLAGGVRGFMTKPINVPAFLDLVADLLHRHGAPVQTGTSDQDFRIGGQ